MAINLNNPGIQGPTTVGVGRVNTGAKDTPDVNAALGKLFDGYKGQWQKSLPAGSTVLGSLQINMGVDASRDVLLVKTGTGSLQLFGQNNIDGGIIKTFAPLASIGDAVTGKPKAFLASAKGYEPLYAGSSLKHTGYNLALTAEGGLFLTQPRSNTILAVL